MQYCCFAIDVTAAMLGVQEQKHFSPLGNELYFYANLAEKFLLDRPTTWPPCHVVANQELVRDEKLSGVTCFDDELISKITFR